MKDVSTLICALSNGILRFEYMSLIVEELGGGVASFVAY